MMQPKTTAARFLFYYIEFIHGFNVQIRYNKSRSFEGSGQIDRKLRRLKYIILVVFMSIVIARPLCKYLYPLRVRLPCSGLIFRQTLNFINKLEQLFGLLILSHAMPKLNWIKLMKKQGLRSIDRPAFSPARESGIQEDDTYFSNQNMSCSRKFTGILFFTLSVG